MFEKGGVSGVNGASKCAYYEHAAQAWKKVIALKNVVRLNSTIDRHEDKLE